MPEPLIVARGSDNPIRPFHVDVPEEDLLELKRRVRATRWPERETVSDQSQGVKLETIQELARYWADEYDWRRIERKINSYPHFHTEIDGLDFHFVHVRSKHENAVPLLIAHGWPGSIIEQMKLIEPLTDPTAHGGSEVEAFHVVIPSMPGYGFSGKPTATGWNPDRIARAYAELMARLGYQKYVAQGGDWGSIVVNSMGVQEPQGLIGIHTNMPEVIPADVDAVIWSGYPLPSTLSDDERKACEQVRENKFAYAFMMGTRPQTLTGLVDSPVGLAAFMIDHDWKSHAMIARSFAGVEEGLTPDDILDNVTLFWLTNTAISAARLYWENTVAGTSFFAAKGVKLPTACSVFPDEMYEAPQSWVEKAYPNLIHFNALPKGGHFAAWEQPEFMTAEIRRAFEPLRQTILAETPDRLKPIMA
ncbi:epoxide hydrolase family protein [Allomesorhizobium alhagi]|uniref:Epoxide hydrolase domain-containing protein n=1 Tax=Mesorhizobium alhagi CCNWXJ12-2 TaxID=1107882 RepID=H0HYW2_9HYPH|nr:epoxide hydrolase [Mesorhizobium alhagi]EHK54087.1 epoxide hydrolase domain-containing protein [Mesorhizobium alhagi CCNWXJ12-2]